MKARDRFLTVAAALFLRWLATGHVTAVLGGTRVTLPALAVALLAALAVLAAAGVIAAACRYRADLAVPAWAQDRAAAGHAAAMSAAISAASQPGDTR